MKRRTIRFGLALAAVALGVGWYWFRPDKLFTNEIVHEEFSTAPTALTAAPTPLFTGNFHGVFHSGKGTATVYQLPDGRQVLRFTDFVVDNGPDLYVYLVGTDDAQDSATVKRAGFVAVDRLKGNQGDQNYELPSQLDWTKDRAVSIWCQRFGVNFATAPLLGAEPSRGPT